ncbi:MAG: exodeoxyribonuclease VII small subunit [bacterium]|jgi:exodeoxyribonuclease VII small subunit
MAKKKPATMETQPFETAMQALEKIVETLENDELSLEASLALFEEGIGLVRLCTRRLDEAEKRIDLLVENSDGSVAFRPFAAEEENAQ